MFKDLGAIEVLQLLLLLREQFGRLFLYHRRQSGSNLVDCFCITDVAGGTIWSTVSVSPTSQREQFGRLFLYH